MFLTRSLAASSSIREDHFRPWPTTAIVAFFLVMVGCAPLISGARSSRADLPCLPPGARAQAFTWPVVDAHPVPVLFETGDVRPGLWVRYQQGRSAVVMVWSATGLLAVDPNPDTDVPGWFDMGLVSEDGKTLRTTPTKRCLWRQYERQPV